MQKLSRFFHKSIDIISQNTADSIEKLVEDINIENYA